ncbi:MAG: LamG-like jellyroll fold domain-containing protein [Solirubrobacteraceae bacterium]
MADAFWVLVPILVLAVALLVGFAGCGFEHGNIGTDPYPQAQKLTFSARVPAALTVIGPGVTFTWMTPHGTAPETTTVTSPASPHSVEAYITTALGLAPSLFWTLGSAGGVADRSGNGHDGTPLGGVTVGAYPDGPTDYPDATATLFDGANDGIGSSYNPFVGTSARTFVGWARWDSGGPAEHTLFGSSAGDNNRPNLRVVVASRDVKWLPSGDDGQVITWPAAAPPGDTWFMWALRADPANATAALFINGANISQQPITEPWPANPGTFQAAVGAANSHPFKGAQGLVAVYERGLMDSEIAQLYQTSHGDSVYEYPLQSPDLGSWGARCEMTVQADSQTAFGSSPYPGTAFSLEESLTYVLSFQATGSPLNPPFTVMDGVRSP